MFDVRNDEIIFKGVCVAKFVSSAWPTIISNAADALEEAESWDDKEREHNEALDKAERQGYAEREEHAERAKTALMDFINELEEDIAPAKYARLNRLVEAI